MLTHSRSGHPPEKNYKVVAGINPDLPRSPGGNLTAGVGLAAPLTAAPLNAEGGRIPVCPVSTDTAGVQQYS